MATFSSQTKQCSVRSIGAAAVASHMLRMVLRVFGTFARQRIEGLAKLSSALGQPREETPGTIAFATATAFGNLRLLVGASHSLWEHSTTHGARTRVVLIISQRRRRSRSV